MTDVNIPQDYIPWLIDRCRVAADIVRIGPTFLRAFRRARAQRSRAMPSMWSFGQRKGRPIMVFQCHDHSAAIDIQRAILEAVVHHLRWRNNG